MGYKSYKIDVEKLRDLRDKILGEIKAFKNNIAFYLDSISSEIDRMFDMLIQFSEDERQPDRPSYELMTEEQKQRLYDLYRKLGRTPPSDLETISRATADALIQSLERQLRAKGERPKENMASEKMITERQKNFLLDLYKQCGMEPPKDLDTWTRRQASEKISELIKEARSDRHA